MRSDKHFRLKVLGRLSLESSADDITRPVVLRPRHLAIFAFLAMSERAVQRDSLVAMFWGDEPEANARHSLSNALSALRGLLGTSAITSRRDIIELSSELRLAVDALEFAAAAEARDDARASELYAGPFLYDAAVQGAPDFDAWAGRIRNRLERAFISTCERRVPALLRAGDWSAAAELSERWLRAAPRSAVAFASVLRGRSGPGTPESIRAALADFVRLKQWLASDYELLPDSSVHELASELESRRAAGERQLAEALARADRTHSAIETSPSTSAGPSTPAAAAEAPADPAASIAASPPARAPRRSSWIRRRTLGRLAIVTTAVVVASAAVFLRVRGPHPAVAATRTVVAITGIESLSGDTALSWLEDGLPQLISDDLAAGGTIETVSPIRVRDVLDRRGTKPGAAVSEPEGRDVARRLGATWVVRGGLTGGGSAFILNLDVEDVATGTAVESFTVMADNPVKLGQLAAARLLDMATSGHGGANDPPRFVGATANPEAYRHFVLGMRASSERRYLDDSREFEAAIALDSGFVEAMLARRDIANIRGEVVVARRMDSLIARHADRLSDWDRLRDEVYRAMYDGEIERSEALAARLVARYPRDPRAYVVRGDVLTGHGRWLAADSVLVRELALDSLAMEAGDGPCAPCAAYAGLVSVRLWRGDLANAERAARRWVALQPGVPGAWEMLSMVLAFDGRFDEAIEAGRRMVSLTSDPDRIADLARTFIEARRFNQADSLIGVLRAAGEPGRDAVLDLALTIARERGQFRRAAQLLGDNERALELIQADNLMRIGRTSEARKHYEASGHFEAPRQAEALSAPQARAFAWAHALEADAFWRAHDTTVAHALLDSVRTIGSRSYYGRDWNLYHHLAGLLALSRHDTTTAERELQSARWGIAGWTATVAMLAKIRLARGDGRGAAALLRDAYAGPLDAMGRYVTRTELDYLYALALAQAGARDSANVYAARVREAWAGADPDVKRLLSALPDARP